jgi:hypothetical protein
MATTDSLHAHIDEYRASQASSAVTEVTIPIGWEQGRGAYGGLVLAYLVRAIERAEPDIARTVRSIAAEIPAPVEPGPASITVTLMRRGNAVSTIRAELTQNTAHGGAELRAHMVAVLATTRPDMPTWHLLSPPIVPLWTDVPVIPVRPPIGPAFGQHFEFRVADGLPFAGTAPRSIGYVRPLIACKQPGAAYVTAMADVWWPCALAVFRQPRPTATLTFTLNLVSDLQGLNHELPLLHHGRCDVSSDGYAQETRELWGHDGRLISVNHQTFVIIK